MGGQGGQFKEGSRMEGTLDFDSFDIEANPTQTHSIFVILQENILLGISKLRECSIFTLSMPYIKTQQIQNHALFSDSCKGPKSVISGDLSKNTRV